MLTKCSMECDEERDYFGNQCKSSKKIAAPWNREEKGRAMSHTKAERQTRTWKYILVWYAYVCLHIVKGFWSQAFSQSIFEPTEVAAYHCRCLDREVKVGELVITTSKCRMTGLEGRGADTDWYKSLPKWNPTFGIFVVPDYYLISCHCGQLHDSMTPPPNFRLFLLSLFFHTAVSLLLSVLCLQCNTFP